MASVNKVILIGNLGKDPDVRSMSSRALVSGARAAECQRLPSHGIITMTICIDWIKEEHRRRQNGVTRGLLPGQHAMVNARYPGCTLEYCCECGEATGNAGRDDGSLYGDDGSGPFCASCFEANE